jgi:hypothetical protein
MWWYTPIIPATWEAAKGRSQVLASPKVTRLCLKNKRMGRGNGSSGRIIV